jgi:hypothetical protein
MISESKLRNFGNFGKLRKAKFRAYSLANTELERVFGTSDENPVHQNFNRLLIKVGCIITVISEHIILSVWGIVEERNWLK